MQTFLFLVASLATLAWAEEPVRPLAGDPLNGARIYRVQCASCHGVNRVGGGPLAEQVGKQVKPPDLTYPGLLIPYDNPALAAFIGKGAKPAMPGFEQALSVLDTYDLIAFLREDMASVGDFFPDAGRYTAKTYQLDSYAIEKVEKATGDKVTPAESKMLVVVGFKGEVPPDGPELVPQEPRLLDTLPWRKKTGYLSFVPVPLGGKIHTVGMGLDMEGMIRVLRTCAGSAADRGKLDPLLAPFIGLGGRNTAKKPFEIPKGTRVKVPPEVVKAVSRGFWRTIGGMGLHDKEERDRHVFDADFGDASVEEGQISTKNKK